MPIHPNIALQLKMTQGQLHADQEQLRAVHFRLLKTRAVIEQATIAIAESYALLVSNKQGGSKADKVG